jgi:tetratricopeptide (TPR) repeat protein
VVDFDPRQLDQLEDALDDLDDLGSLELSPAVTERLAEYQSVLALCRAALPVEEPRVDLLADVIAEAHAVSRRAKLREPIHASPWRRFWDRWRGTVIPSLALAGTAAAVLLLIEPERELDRTDERLSANTQEREQPRPPSEPASEQTVEAEAGEGGAAPAEPPATDSDDAKDPVAGQPQASPPPGTSKTSKLRKRSSSGAGIATPTAKPSEPAPEPLSKDDTWTELERANADRRRGDCDRARTRYEQIIAASSDSLAIARSQAGIGLCLEQDRRTAEADRLFEQARATNPGVDAWIDGQRDEQPLPGETKKAKSKKNAAAFDDAL